MLKNLSNKKKFYIIILLIVLFTFMAYNKSFKNTVSTVTFYSDAKVKIKHSETLQDDLINLHVNLKQMDELIGKKTENPKIIQNEILNFLTQNQNLITLTKIDNLHVFSDEYFKVYSNKITINGGFNDIVKTVYEIENEFEYARIGSIKMYVTRDPITTKKELYSDIIFQNYEKQN